jgi:RNA polymerase sigma factor (sigma-70 family)
MTDDKLINLLVNQKVHRALRHLYAYLKPVIGDIRTNQGNKQDAEDIIQVALAFFCVKVRNENFRPKSYINTYIYGVCKNLWRNHLRKKRPELTEEFSVKEEEIKFDESEQFNQAQIALDTFGKKCMELLDLFYIQSFKMDEIAKQL